LQDISEHQRRAVLERAFVTDISGTIAAVLGRSKLLLTADVERGRLLAEDIFQSLIRLAQEVRIQKSLIHESEQEISPLLRLTAVAEVLSEVLKACQAYPQAKGRRIRLDDKAVGFRFKTDSWLLRRVIGGMVLNALEAAGEGDEIRIKAEIKHTTLVFSVWNGQCIPEDVTKRIFQQNFSTHTDSLGRGVGTYFMKVIGEQALGGKVDFTTSAAEGTEFRLSLNVSCQ
jgi:K+-sensing histidine kinase KdpD